MIWHDCDLSGSCDIIDSIPYIALTRIMWLPYFRIGGLLMSSWYLGYLVAYQDILMYRVGQKTGPHL